LAYEEPHYEIVRSTPDFELRRYAPHAVVETTASGDFTAARNAAFRRLFDYISGNNRVRVRIEMTVPVVTEPAGEKIDMTVPVLTRPAEGQATLMQFVLPSRFNAATAPEPNDPALRIRDVNSRLIAARTYSGGASEANYRKNEATLMAALKEAQLVTTDAPSFAVYNRPFTPGFMRRNEVLVPVEPQR
jgi:hypothetical protein